MVGCRTFGQRDVLKLGKYCLCPSGETLQDVGPFYMPGEVKYPTQGVNMQHSVDSISHEPLKKCS